MKTKFSGISEDKQSRKKLRDYALAYLLALSDKVTRSDYKLLQIDRRYILPFEQARGYLVCRFNDTESIRYYVSPGIKTDSYIADKVEFWYTDDGQAVSFDITGQAWTQEFFHWLEITGRVLTDITLAQRAN